MDLDGDRGASSGFAWLEHVLGLETQQQQQQKKREREQETRFRKKLKKKNKVSLTALRLLALLAAIPPTELAPPP